MKLLVFSITLLFTLSSSKEEKIQIYGNYCGRGHYSTRGAIPIDDLDRVCQIHDICTGAAGTVMSCFCNEQLYAKMSELRLTTSVQEDERDSDLTFIFDSLLFCPNYNSLNNRYLIANTNNGLIENNRGFTYLPVYGYFGTKTNKYITLLNSSNVKVYGMTRNTYQTHFVDLAYQYPINTYLYFDHRYSLLSVNPYSIYQISPEEVIIFLNDQTTTYSYVVLDENPFTSDILIDVLTNRLNVKDKLIQNITDACEIDMHGMNSSISQLKIIVNSLEKYSENLNGLLRIEKNKNSVLILEKDRINASLTKTEREKYEINVALTECIAKPVLEKTISQNFILIIVGIVIIGIETTILLCVLAYYLAKRYKITKKEIAFQELTSITQTETNPSTI